MYFTDEDLQKMIKSCTILDYKDQYVQEIKDDFARECADDTTLSEEFKEYVSNPDHIQVSFNYGWNMKVYLYSATVKIHCTWTTRYYATTGYSGTGTINSSGNVSISNLHETSEARKYDSSKDYSERVYPNAGEEFLSSIGTAEYEKSDARHYKKLSFDSPMPQELKDLCEKVFTVKEVHSYMTQQQAPKLAREKAEASVLSFHETDSNVQLTNFYLEDYGIDRIDLYLMPSSFNISTTYKGKTYERKDIHCVTSFGETSEHYNAWLDTCEDFSKKRAIEVFPKILLIIGGLITLLPLVLLLTRVVQDISKFMSVVMHIPLVNILFIAGPMALSVFLGKTYMDPFDPPSYDEEIPKSEFKKVLQRHYKKQLFKRVILSLLYIGLCCLYTRIWFPR